jgi:hypothetical protein
MHSVQETSAKLQVIVYWLILNDRCYINVDCKTQPIVVTCNVRCYVTYLPKRLADRNNALHSLGISQLNLKQHLLCSMYFMIASFEQSAVQGEQ